MSVTETMRLWEERVRRIVRDMVRPAEFGTITESGLQLDSFRYPIRTYHCRQGVSLAVGSRVVAQPIGDGSEYWVDGPIERWEVSG